MSRLKSYEDIFSGITDQKNTLYVHDKYNRRKFEIGLDIGDIAFRITQTGIVSSVLADLIDLSVAIYAADWLLPKYADSRSEIEIKLPLRNRQLFEQQNIKEQLQNLLDWYTGDDWVFRFDSREQTARAIECQPSLPLASRHTEVALWSGGLDALAGANDRILARTAERYTLFGTGSSTHVLGQQCDIFTKFKKVSSSEINLIGVPIRLEYNGANIHKNTIFRARGIVFKLLGAVCAMLEDQQRLYIYENGYGALNLPFTQFETSLMHTRAVYPSSLKKLGEFVSMIMNEHFTFDNPYIFHTKAQMCKSFGVNHDLAFTTVSCDGRHRLSEKLSQCGYCSSCLLRRLALWQAFGKDGTTDYLFDQTKGVNGQRNHFHYMDLQVRKLTNKFSAGNSWPHLLDYYPDLYTTACDIAESKNISLDYVQMKIAKMFQTHCKEWEQHRAILKN
ncbi:hypothetical protein KFU94_53770 [Chloroflexi bacterium TSY]|nr:hypothetical protein [Chloroflexi bacterium TSY]